MRRKTDGRVVDLGPELREERKRRGLSQAAAAAEIGVSRKTVIRIESGIYVAHANTRAKVHRWMAAGGQTAAAADERAAAEPGPDKESNRPSRWPIAVAAASMQVRRTVRRKTELALRQAVARKMAKKKRC